jgi:hypothetical protein
LALLLCQKGIACGAGQSDPGELAEYYAHVKVNQHKGTHEDEAHKPALFRHGVAVIAFAYHRPAVVKWKLADYASCLSPEESSRVLVKAWLLAFAGWCRHGLCMCVGGSTAKE